MLGCALSADSPAGRRHYLQENILRLRAAEAPTASPRGQAVRWATEPQALPAPACRGLPPPPTAAGRGLRLPVSAASAASEPQGHEHSEPVLDEARAFRDPPPPRHSLQRLLQPPPAHSRELPGAPAPQGRVLRARSACSSWLLPHPLRQGHVLCLLSGVPWAAPRGLSSCP